MAKRKRKRSSRRFGVLEHPHAAKVAPSKKMKVDVRVHVWRTVSVRGHGAGYCATAAVKGFTSRRGERRGKYTTMLCTKTPTGAFKAALSRLAKKVR